MLSETYITKDQQQQKTTIFFKESLGSYKLLVSLMFFQFDLQISNFGLELFEKENPI